MRTTVLALVVSLTVSLPTRAAESALTRTLMSSSRGAQAANHASCVVELPGGDLLATWYRGSGERQADDVQIWAARLRKGKTAWSLRFLLADTPGYPDRGNPRALPQRLR